MSTCPLCKDFEGEPSSVEAHISSKTDETHQGEIGQDYREDLTGQEIVENHNDEALVDLEETLLDEGGEDPSRSGGGHHSEDHATEDSDMASREEYEQQLQSQGIVEDDRDDQHDVDGADDRVDEDGDDESSLPSAGEAAGTAAAAGGAGMLATDDWETQKWMLLGLAVGAVVYLWWRSRSNDQGDGQERIDERDQQDDDGGPTYQHPVGGD